MYSPIQSKNNHQYIVEQIKQMILEGQLNIGDKLPPERELSELYHVSRTSIREALKSLEALGLLEIRQGDGNYIANNISDKAGDLVSLFFVLQDCDISDLSWIRYVLELNSLHGFVHRKDENEIKKFEALIERVKNAKMYEEINQIDMELHELMLSMENKDFFRFLYASTGKLYNEDIEYANFMEETLEREPLEDVIDYMLDILEAIVSLDVSRISRALFDHYALAENDRGIKYSDAMSMLSTRSQNK